MLGYDSETIKSHSFQWNPKILLRKSEEYTDNINDLVMTWNSL